MGDIKKNIIDVKANIKKYCDKYSRNPQNIRLLAVSKTKPVEYIVKAYEMGISNFAENYLQDAITKITRLQNKNITWHFIGKVQSNKTSTIAANFDWVHCVDRAKTINRLNLQRDEKLPPLNCCIQVNFDNDKDKGGVSDITKIKDLCQMVSEKRNLKLRGVMGIGKMYDSLEAQKKSFLQLSNIYNKLQERFYLDTLSMGMSQDLEAAIYAGSTCVRVGTDIFGAR
jgi:PLP dependent protein